MRNAGGLFRRKRGDASVGAIEKIYGVRFNARPDMLLETLLQQRGFASLSQLLKAYRGHLRIHARRRRVFLSFHAEDLPQIRGFRLMAMNPKVNLDLEDKSLFNAVNSDRNAYVRQAIRDKIQAAEVVACLIGHGTAWRDWVEWELEVALQLGKGICGVMLKDSRGRHPQLLKEICAPIANWNVQSITSAIECAAARRS